MCWHLLPAASPSSLLFCPCPVRCIWQGLLRTDSNLLWFGLWRCWTGSTGLVPSCLGWRYSQVCYTDLHASERHLWGCRSCSAQHASDQPLFAKTLFVFLATISIRHTSVAMRPSDQAMSHLKQDWHLWVPSTLNAWQNCISWALLFILRWVNILHISGLCAG